MNTLRQGAALAFAVLVFSGDGYAADVSESLNCMALWNQSEARHSCEALRTGDTLGGPIPIANESGFRQCEIKARCKNAIGVLTINSTFKIDINDVSKLNNCNGELRAGSC